MRQDETSHCFDAGVTPFGQGQKDLLPLDMRLWRRMCELLEVDLVRGKDFYSAPSHRRGSGNLDNVVSGSLASPEPPTDGEADERGNEANETESRAHV
jgi:hypothetical protein